MRQLFTKAVILLDQRGGLSLKVLSQEISYFRITQVSFARDLLCLVIGLSLTAANNCSNAQDFGNHGNSVGLPVPVNRLGHLGKL